MLLCPYQTLCRLFLRHCTIGSLAAGLQAGIGNVAAGSLFAGAQATAMGAGIPILAQAIGGTVTGVVGAALAVIV